MQKSFRWWQCSDKYIISPPPHTHTSFMVSVDVISTMFTYLIRNPSGKWAHVCVYMYVFVFCFFVCVCYGSPLPNYIYAKSTVDALLLLWTKCFPTSFLSLSLYAAFVDCLVALHRWQHLFKRHMYIIRDSCDDKNRSCLLHTHTHTPNKQSNIILLPTLLLHQLLTFITTFNVKQSMSDKQYTIFHDTYVHEFHTILSTSKKRKRQALRCRRVDHEMQMRPWDRKYGNSKKNEMGQQHCTYKD